jgi:hypothetical protein
MGQRLLTQDSLRTRFDLYLNPSELASIKEKAEIARLATSAYIRNAALGQTVKAPPSLLTVQALREISRIGSNINQLAVIAAVGKAQQIDQEQLAKLSKELREVWHRLKEPPNHLFHDCKD